MKITKRQLRRIIREAMKLTPAQEVGMEDFGKRFDDSYKQPDGSYTGHPDEEMAIDAKIAYKFRADIDSGVDLEEAWLTVRQALEDNFPDRDERWEAVRDLQYNPMTKEIKDDLELYKDEGIFPDY